ncbi:HIT domain-containing protein [Pelistega sp. NLN82]|uniref:HIT domain-containing protein n=1 Tax=Pelistega ratti TaxID=2652177 RepID=A0A6L9YA96_9BURK|nr:HIT domain-containing protein [Pelistega ratti]NEN76644.1 HIT domain-containing protein [Pelistega ratti]
MQYDNNNVFAKILRGELPSFNVYEDDKTYAMMDIMPQSKGHLLILTKEPAPTFFELSEEGAKACIATAKKIAPILMKITQADGLILTQFNHECAGQTVFHVHYHLIPRYAGQQNVQAHARVEGDKEEIKALAEALRHALAKS